MVVSKPNISKHIMKYKKYKKCSFKNWKKINYSINFYYKKLFAQNSINPILDLPNVEYFCNKKFSFGMQILLRNKFKKKIFLLVKKNSF